MSGHAQDFVRRAEEKAGDLTHRKIIRFNMDQYDAAFARGYSRFADWEAAREQCQRVKWDAVNHLDRYLLQFEQKVKARGGHVFWAENSEEARKYVCELA